MCICIQSLNTVKSQSKNQNCKRCYSTISIWKFELSDKILKLILYLFSNIQPYNKYFSHELAFKTYGKLYDV